jgi:hypothetical protein
MKHRLAKCAVCLIPATSPATITCPTQTTNRRNFGYSENCVGTKGRKRSPRQGNCSPGRSNHNPSQDRHQRAFQQRLTYTKEAPPSDCRGTKAAIYADEKALGGKEEEELIRPQTTCQSYLTDWEIFFIACALCFRCELEIKHANHITKKAAPGAS